MIERSVINGRPATIIHINADFTPAEQGPLVKAVFDDGRVLFLVREEPLVKRSIPRRRLSRRMLDE